MNTQASLQALRETVSRRVDLATHGELNLRCLTALERILSHVAVELDVNPDTPIDGGDLVEVTLDALRRAGLLERETSPSSGDVRERILRELRARVGDPDECIVATRGDGVWAPLDVGGLGQRTRAGAILARLLAVPGDGPWYIIAVRPGSPRTVVKRVERDAADRIASAARLVDVPLAGISLDIRGGRTFHLYEARDV